MVWPFSRKTPSKATTTPREKLTGPRAEGADQAVIDQIVAWFATEHPNLDVQQDGDQRRVLVGPTPQALPTGDAPAGAVLRIKKGKLSWVDLWDPTLRAPINALVKTLDKQQLWYFNGVISTKYPTD